MATRLVRTCDPHGAKEIEVEALPIPIGLGTRWYSVDLCPECEGDYLSRLRALIEEFGAPIDGPQNVGKPPAKKPGKGGKTGVLSAAGGNLPVLLGRERMGRTPAKGRPLRCFWCPLTYSGEQALGTHVVKEHGLAGRGKVIYGRQCPICGEDGYDILGSHINRAHREAEGTNQAFQIAAELGDPFGVVAKQMAQAEWIDGGLVIAADVPVAATP